VFSRMSHDALACSLSTHLHLCQVMYSHSFLFFQFPEHSQLLVIFAFTECYRACLRHIPANLHVNYALSHHPVYVVAVYMLDISSKFKQFHLIQ